MKNQQKTILLVEDDSTILTILTKYLKREGYKVLPVRDGASALDFFKAYKPNLIILDLNLPFVDGLEVAKRIRDVSDVPIIMATARTAEIDELNGLRVGADDYVKKPFSPRVLIEKVKLLLKKHSSVNTSSKITFANGYLDKTNYILSINKKPATLTKAQTKIVETLLHARGNTVSRHDLMNALDTKTTDLRIIDAQIKNIRKTIASDNFIQTVRGIGYKINSKYVI